MQKHASEPGPFSSIPGVDPYVDWAFGAGGSYFVVMFEGREWLPVLLETSGIAARDLMKGEWADLLQISPLYRQPPAGLDGATHCTALVTKEFFGMLRTNERLKKQIARVAIGPPLRSENLPEVAPPPNAERN